MPFNMSRRSVLKTLGMGTTAIIVPGLRSQMVRAQQDVRVIEADSFYPNGQWFFNPAGLFIEKGQTVRWISRNLGPTVTAFHPSIGNHELRIPEKAKPFDSWVLTQRDKRYDTFEWTFDVEGTYDYYSRTFEPLGMVGRIVVGRPGGPAELHPPGYGGREGRAVVFPAEAKMLAALPSAEIVARKSVPYPKDLVVRSFPYGDVK